MRNSDFSPSRFEAQEDACNLISGKKTRDNVENVVGLMTTAGKHGTPEVLVSLSQDPGKLLTAMHKIKLGGEADLVSSIQIARVCGAMDVLGMASFYFVISCLVFISSLFVCYHLVFLF
jgi:26S proteasome regulatory subunit N10